MLDRTSEYHYSYGYEAVKAVEDLIPALLVSKNTSSCGFLPQAAGVLETPQKLFHNTPNDIVARVETLV